MCKLSVVVFQSHISYPSTTYGNQNELTWKRRKQQVSCDEQDPIWPGDSREPINVATQDRARHHVVETQTGVAKQSEIENG